MVVKFGYGWTMARARDHDIRPSKRNLRWHFLGKSLAVAIGLIAVTLLILKQLDSSYSSYNNQLKTLQMAHSIDNVAMISQSPTQMQHYIRSLQQNDRVESILLISKHDSKILLASEPRLIGKPLDELPSDIAGHVR